MKTMFSIFLTACLIALPAAGFAASPWTEAETYGDKSVEKLDFGFKNLFVGWVDLFQEPYEASRQGRKWTSGLGKGIADAILNTAGGAFHAVTFFIPVDVPLPDNGVHLDEEQEELEASEE